MKRPSDLRSCDFYPTLRGMSLSWDARILDCFRIDNDAADIFNYYSELASSKRLPSLTDLLQQAECLVDRYSSFTAYDQALSLEEIRTSEERLKIRPGTPWSPLTSSMDKLASTDSELYVEAEGFAGDRVLANSITFLLEYGWLTELSYAVPEGDIGRVYQIFLISIFVFGGSNNQNYMNYFLETYCLLKYESSPELKEAILNNWLVCLTGKEGNYKEGDLMQEHNNRFLEEAVEKCGGDFDNDFLHKTISPNLHHFMQIKEQLTTAYDLDNRGKRHTSRDLNAELRMLLSMYKAEELHSFRSGRSMGHACKNLFNEGYKGLNGGKLKKFVKKSLPFAEFIRKTQETTSDLSSDSTIHSTNVGDDTSDTEDDDGDDSERQLRSGSYGSSYLDEDGQLIDGHVEELGDMITDKWEDAEEAEWQDEPESDGEESCTSDVIPEEDDADEDVMMDVE